MHMYIIFIILLQNYEKVKHAYNYSLHVYIQSYFNFMALRLGFLKIIYFGRVNMTPPPLSNLHFVRAFGEGQCDNPTFILKEELIQY